QQMTSAQFEERSRRGWILPATVQQSAQNQQLAAVRGAQFQRATAQPLTGAQSALADVSGRAGDTGIPVPVVARVRAIRIDIPREGQAFAFTKVLHLDKTLLAVQAKVMRLHTFQTVQMILQLTAFLAGLLVWWWQWLTARNSFILTLALALSLGAVGSLLLAWRLLHLALIWLTPVLLLAFLAWLTWRFWPRSHTKLSTPKTGFEPGIPPAMAAIAFLTLSLSGASALPGNV